MDGTGSVSSGTPLSAQNSPSPDAGAATIQLMLFIRRGAPLAEAAVEYVATLCREVGAHVNLRVVDVRENPEIAEAHAIIATPALIRTTGTSTVRLVGDLADRRRVAHYLLPEHPAASA